MGEGSADYYHLIIEATKEAFIDRNHYLSDPDFVNIPLHFLLSDEHGKEQAAQINMSKTDTPCQSSSRLPLLDPKGDTIWLGVVDSEGNCVSLIQSVYHDFGSGIVAGNTGILLQNRGSFFSLNPGHVNRLEPYKRTFHTLNPAMLLCKTKEAQIKKFSNCTSMNKQLTNEKENVEAKVKEEEKWRPYLLYGTMGGEGQPQTQAAIVTRIVDFGMSPQAAIDAPRWLYGRTWGAAINSLRMEGRIPMDVIRELREKGHELDVVEDFTELMGHAGSILIKYRDQDTNMNEVEQGSEEKGKKRMEEIEWIDGASDLRGDGIAVGF